MDKALEEAPVYERRIRIECGDKAVGHQVKISDLVTGELLPHVVSVIVYLNPTEINIAELTYLATNDRGEFLTEGEGADAHLVERKMYVNNPEVDLSAYERRRV